VKYELIREIFNLCSGNQMRDVFVSEVETDNTDEYIKQFLTGGKVSVEKSRNKEGSIIFDVVTDDLRQRYTFTEE